jgi:hypothetical protein
MKTETGLQWRTRVFSTDLSQVIGERGLLKLALDSVQTIEPARLTPPGSMQGEFRTQMMLTLLTYCYASSLFGSRDIESATDTDATIRYICARTPPNWLSIRRFRRHYREAVLDCLIYVMKQVWALKFDEGEADYVGYDWFESDVVAQIDSAARQRLDVAALMDGAENEY